MALARSGRKPELGAFCRMSREPPFNSPDTAVPPETTTRHLHAMLGHPLLHSPTAPFALLVAGRMFSSLVFDHYGLFGVLQCSGSSSVRRTSPARWEPARRSDSDPIAGQKPDTPIGTARRNHGKFPKSISNSV